MAQAGLSTYDHDLRERSPALDPAEVLRRGQAWFPQAIVVPGDKLAEAADHAERFAKGLPAGEQIVNSLRRKAELYGPAYNLKIPRADGPPILGVFRRFDAYFLWEGTVSDDLRESLLAFLRSLGHGEPEFHEDRRRSQGS